MYNNNKKGGLGGSLLVIDLGLMSIDSIGRMDVINGQFKYIFVEVK